MINLFIIALMKRAAFFFLNIAQYFMARTDSKTLFPLPGSSSDNISKTEGIYFKKFQALTNSIPGMISQDQATLLFYLSTFSQIRGDIIEIGSWLGKSTVFLAKGCKVSGNGVVHAIDTFKGNIGKEKMYEAPLREGETIYRRFMKNIKSAALEKYVKVYKTTSKEARKIIRSKARILFIDGCHEYEAVKDDIKTWKGLLLAGGFIALDDFNKRFPGSVIAIKEEIIDSGEFKVLVVTDSLLIAQKL